MTQTNTATNPEPEFVAAERNQGTTQKYSTIFRKIPTVSTATPAFQECARLITQGRQRGKHLADTSTSIGSAEADFTATYYGTLAELLLYDGLEQNGGRPEYTLLSKRAVTESDFRLDGLRYEIKCSPPGKKFLSISVRQHHDPRRRSDFYVLCLFETPETLRVLLPVPHTDVSHWTRMDNRHEPYYSRARAELLIPSSDHLKPDTEAALRFLAMLTDGYTDPGLRLEIRPLYPAWMESILYPKGDAPDNWQCWTPKGTRQWFTLDAHDVEKAARHAIELTRRYEVYCSVLPRQGETGKAADVPGVFWFWCDIDGGDDGPEGALRLLKAAGLPEPHIIIVSGGGLHVYWRLSAPVPLPDDEARRQFKSLLKRLCLKIGGASPAAHADSSRADVASILRVPGTFNRKRQDEPRPVQLLDANPDAETKAFAWWRANLPALPAPAPKPSFRSASPLAVGEGLLRWADRGYPEGKRHKDLVAAAAWLIRDKQIDKMLAEELLRRKAQASPGMRQITEQEIREMVEWA